MSKFENIIITAEYLNKNPNHVFVYGDNTLRRGYGGAAALRDHINTYGFITKKFPNWDNNSYYTPAEYDEVFNIELKNLKQIVSNHPEQTYLISKLGAGLANKYYIWEHVIVDRLIESLKDFDNVVFLWDEYE